MRNIPRSSPFSFSCFLRILTLKKCEKILPEPHFDNITSSLCFLPVCKYGKFCWFFALFWNNCGPNGIMTGWCLCSVLRPADKTFSENVPKKMREQFGKSIQFSIGWVMNSRWYVCIGAVPRLHTKRIWVGQTQSCTWVCGSCCSRRLLCVGCSVMESKGKVKINQKMPRKWKLEYESDGKTKIGVRRQKCPALLWTSWTNWTSWIWFLVGPIGPRWTSV